MKLTPLFSGSSGNCLLAEEGSSRILIDAGGNAKRITAALAALSVSITDISCILITHEHIDHTAGVGVLNRRCGISAAANGATMAAMYQSLGKVRDELFVIFENGRPFSVGDILVTAFPSSHDAADPVGFVLEGKKERAAVLTDTGMMTRECLEAMKGAKTVCLEANHDLRMLREGPYPAFLKQRIISDFGHLSNAMTAQAAVELIGSGCEKLILAHLSQDNNTPEIALQTVLAQTEAAGMREGSDFCISVAMRFEAAGAIFV